MFSICVLRKLLYAEFTSNQLNMMPQKRAVYCLASSCVRRKGIRKTVMARSCKVIFSNSTPCVKRAFRHTGPAKTTTDEVLSIKRYTIACRIMPAGHTDHGDEKKNLHLNSIEGQASRRCSKLQRHGNFCFNTIGHVAMKRCSCIEQCIPKDTSYSFSGWRNRCSK